MANCECHNQWVNHRQPISRWWISHLISIKDRLTSSLTSWRRDSWNPASHAPRIEDDSESALEVWTLKSLWISRVPKRTDCHAFLAQNIAIAINEWAWMHESPNRWLQTTLWHALKKTCGRHNTGALLWSHECWRSQQTKVYIYIYYSIYSYSHERANVTELLQNRSTNSRSMPWDSTDQQCLNDTIPMRSVTTSEEFFEWSCPTILITIHWYQQPNGCGFDWPKW